MFSGITHIVANDKLSPPGVAYYFSLRAQLTALNKARDCQSAGAFPPRWPHFLWIPRSGPLRSQTHAIFNILRNHMLVATRVTLLYILITDDTCSSSPCPRDPGDSHFNSCKFQFVLLVLTEAEPPISHLSIFPWETFPQGIFVQGSFLLKGLCKVFTYCTMTAWQILFILINHFYYLFSLSES